MPIVGFKFNEISAKSGKEASSGEISVSIGLPKIINISMKRIGGLEILSFEFEFSLEYANIDSKVTMKGEVFYEGDDKDEILKQWESEKKIKDDILLPVLNFAFKKCIAKAMNLAEDLRLPYPIRLPEIRLKE